MIFFAPLLAAVDADWLKIIAFIVLGAIYLIKQIHSASKAQKKAHRPRQPVQDRPVQQIPERPRQQGPERPRQAAPAAQERRVPAGRGALDNEVNEFLRRAGQKRDVKPAATVARQADRAQTPAKLSQARDAAGRPGIGQSTGASIRRASDAPLRRGSSLDVVDVEAIEEAPSPGKIGTRVEPHLDTRAFDERASHLAQVTKAEGAMRSHLHQVFDHQVGKLATPAPADPAEGEAAVVTVGRFGPSFAAAALADLLSDPEQVRSAIIMNEILSRPTHRW